MLLAVDNPDAVCSFSLGSPLANRWEGAPTTVSRTATSLASAKFSPSRKTLKKKVKRLEAEERMVFDVTDVSSSDVLKHSCARNHSGATAAAAFNTVHRDTGCALRDNTPEGCRPGARPPGEVQASSVSPKLGVTMLTGSCGLPAPPSSAASVSSGSLLRALLQAYDRVSRCQTRS